MAEVWALEDASESTGVVLVGAAPSELFAAVLSKAGPSAQLAAVVLVVESLAAAQREAD